MKATQYTVTCENPLQIENGEVKKATKKYDEVVNLVNKPIHGTPMYEALMLRELGISITITRKNAVIEVKHEENLIFASADSTSVAAFLFGLRKGYVMRKENFCPCFGE